MLTHPHSTSVAVWGTPTPVVISRSFRVTVGVKCAAACPLAGRVIEVRDATGACIGKSTLGETPWPGTNALYVADVELAAPAAEDVHAWSASCAAAEAEDPHAEASATFTFRTARPPEHRVTVQIIDKETQVPVEEGTVCLGIYRASTDAQGQARLEVPRGTYDLDARKVGYQTARRTVEVNDDLMIQVECAAEHVDLGSGWM